MSSAIFIVSITKNESPGTGLSIAWIIFIDEGIYVSDEDKSGIMLCYDRNSMVSINLIVFFFVMQILWNIQYSSDGPMYHHGSTYGP